MSLKLQGHRVVFGGTQAPRRPKIGIRIIAQSTTSVAPQIRQAIDESELKSASLLRANAFYEDQSWNRFKASFIKQFAEQEYRRLAAQPPLNVTLVATNPTSGTCTGTLDIKSTSVLNERQLEGIPATHSQSTGTSAAYVLNVVVDEDLRGRGIGKALIAAAKEFAVKEWGCSAMYCHVDVVNTVAAGLYERCGFQGVSCSQGVVGNSTVGQRMLLQCDL